MTLSLSLYLHVLFSTEEKLVTLIYVLIEMSMTSIRIYFYRESIMQFDLSGPFTLEFSKSLRNL